MELATKHPQLQKTVDFAEWIVRVADGSAGIEGLTIRNTAWADEILARGRQRGVLPSPDCIERLGLLWLEGKLAAAVLGKTSTQKKGTRK